MSRLARNDSEMARGEFERVALPNIAYAVERTRGLLRVIKLRANPEISS